MHIRTKHSLIPYKYLTKSVIRHLINVESAYI